MPRAHRRRKGSAGTMSVSGHYIETRHGTGKRDMRMLLMTLLVAAAALPAHAQRPPDLSGHWVMRAESLPPQVTDTAAARRDSLRADSLRADSLRSDSLRPRRDRQGEAGERGEGARGPGGAPPGRLGPNPAERQQISRLLGMAQPVPSFTLEQSDTAIVVTNEDGFSYTLHPDGRKRQLVTGQDTLTVRARWKDGALLAEYEPKGGGKLTEHYFLADSRQFLRLEVTVEHKALMRPVWQPRIYRKVAESP
jgi:hypothetical protein